jgi:hypothetical protein
MCGSSLVPHDSGRCDGGYRRRLDFRPREGCVGRSSTLCPRRHSSVGHFTCNLFFGLVIFSYAYELYDCRRALALTLLLGAVGLAIIYIGVAIASVLRCLPKKDSGENSDADSGHTSAVGGFYVDKPEGAGSGPDGNILSLGDLPTMRPTVIRYRRDLRVLYCESSWLHWSLNQCCFISSTESSYPTAG